MTYLERAKKVIPGGAQTRSKSYMQFGEGVYPVVAKYGTGCLIATDTATYVDWISALGSNILGYQRNACNETDYPSMSLPSWREVELAEELAKRMTFAPMWRFATNGMDATTCAIKLARAFTDRIPFISVGYHGHAEIFSCIMTINGGTNPKLKEDIIDIEWEFKSLDRLVNALETINSVPYGALIIEYPPIESRNYNKIAALSLRIREACRKHGIIFIMDEVLTFMRGKDYCLSNELGLEPDLICLGKALGNGYPISAIGGRTDLMQQMGEGGNVFFSNTFSGFDMSLIASLHCLKQYDMQNAYKTVYAFGLNMLMELDRIGTPYGFSTVGDPFRIKIKHSDPTKEKILAQQLVKLGHLTMPSGYIMPNLAHTRLGDKWIKDFKGAMERSMTAELEGIAAKPLLLQNR